MLNATAHSDSIWRSVPKQFRGHKVRPTAQVIPWDGVNESSQPLLKWMDQFGPLQTLVVFAGVTPATSTEMGLNKVIAKAYLRAAAECGVSRVVLASSSAVYGAGNGSPLTETDACHPLNDYGRSKRDMEIYAQSQISESLEVCCIRIGNVAGADALLLSAPSATEDKPLKIHRFANGRGPLRSYISPGHLADILTQLATTCQPLPNFLNVAGETPIHMEDLAQAVGLPWVYTPAPDGAQPSITLDRSLLTQYVKMPYGSGDPSVIAQGWAKT